MKKPPKKPRNKPYFCHDENLEFYSLRKDCNREARFLGIIQIAGKRGMEDLPLMHLCQKQDVHIITHNTKHFRNPPDDITVGVICIGLRQENYWVPKFKKLLKAYPKHKDYYNKLIIIDETITIKNRITQEVRML